MKLKDYTKEELESMSYADIALKILNESQKKMKINDIFKKIAEILEMNENEYIDKLPAFFDILSQDHRFIMLENGMWDLRINHSTKVVIENEEDEDEELMLDDNDEEENDEMEEDKDLYSEDEDDDLDDEDDLSDLVIIDDEEEANGMV